jgi:succinyl-CoA synthetase beta subunit
MKIHEYQAKELFRAFGIPVPRGRVAVSGAEAEAVASELGGERWVVKAQIHAGGRGKGGGVRIARSLEEVGRATSELLSTRLITAQTGSEGRQIRRVLVEEAVTIDRELYVGMLVDPGSGRPVLIVSHAGGMEIEEVARSTPERIRREVIDPYLGVRAFQTRRISAWLGLGADSAGAFGAILRNLFRLFCQEDCSLVEINPLVVTDTAALVAIDAKVTFDDNALFKHKEHASLRDIDEEDPLEAEASRHNVNYIKLDGTIGCMVNGAGLAMATMDLIKLVGGEPANFLDVGGAASAQSVEQAFRILLGDPKVKAILVNIFGGIVRCDRVAQGIIEAAARVSVSVPVVIRLEGTNAQEARRMLEASGFSCVVATGLAEAARRAVALAG